MLKPEQNELAGASTSQAVTLNLAMNMRPMDDICEV